jgi:hypothetical protein
MKNVRKLSPAIVLVATLLLAGIQPGAAPEYGDWEPPVMLPGPINAMPTFAAVVTRDGLTMYCTRGTPPATDLYVSRRATVDELWGTPESLGEPINTQVNEMIPALSRDEHWLFFTSDRPGGIGSWDLWASYRRHTKNPFGWEFPVNLGPHVNTPAQETTGTYWENDDRGLPLLFFASNRVLITPETPAGLPIGHDIYVSELQPDGTFGPAVLDEELSLPFGTPGGDMEGRPVVRYDGREIIFVAERTGSVGTQDLWVARRDSPEEPWGAPENLAAVNTTAAELHPYLSPDGRTLYFSRRIAGLPYIHMTTRERYRR